MKFWKSIGLYVVYPMIMLGVGFYIGVKSEHFFYPGEQAAPAGERTAQELLIVGEQEPTGAPERDDETDENGRIAENSGRTGANQEEGPEHGISEPKDVEYDREADAQRVSSSMETLCVDTQYVLEETDILNGTVVETVWRLPDKYVGLNREQFLEAMDAYEAFPPLSEIERGFVDLEVLSFSRERVVVQMNYQYVQPSTSFYLAVRDNEVVVYLEDRETIYINTGIELDSLPEEIQEEIIQMIWIEDEESLYDFLEAYSS